MSGIAGVVGTPHSDVVGLAALLDFGLTHRGPHGAYVALPQGKSDPVRAPHPIHPSTLGAPAVAALLHRGMQPETATCIGPVCAVVAGGFSNQRELASILAVPPDLDAATVLAHAWLRWGEEALERLDGSWALVLFDRRRHVLVGARDHVGVGQLYYTLERDAVLLASEPKAVAAARAAGREIAPLRFVEFLSGFPPTTADESFFRAVRAVPAGGLLRIGMQTGGPDVSTEEYWHPRTLPGWNAPPPRFEDAVDGLETRLRQAVAQMAHEHHGGALLSGGLDSSVLAAMAARACGDAALPSFSILHTDPELSEERWARAVAAHCGLDAHTHTITPHDAWKAVDEVVSVQGEPLLGQDLIGQWYAYRLAAEHGATTVLDGIGADELLAGAGTESHHLRDLLAHGEVRELARELAALKRRHRLSWPRTLRRYLLGPWKRDLSRAILPRRYRWLTGDAPSDPARHRLRDDVAPSGSRLLRYLYLHLRHQNAPTVLSRLDRCSAGRGVRALVPYLDRRVVEWCLPLPPPYRLSRGQPKRLLHAVASRWLPAQVVARTDKRAIVSSTAWMPLRTTHADALRAMTGERRIRECGYLDPREVEHFVTAYLAGRHDDHLGVWRLYTAWRWMELFGL